MKGIAMYDEKWMNDMCVNEEQRDWYWYYRDKYYRDKYYRDKFVSKTPPRGWDWDHVNKVPVTVEEDEAWESRNIGVDYARAGIDPLPESARRIAAECDRIKAFLVEKNLAYGNSALEPVRIFSSASTVEQLLVRIDDKLSRMENGFEHGDDDTTLDLIGYLILLRIALSKESA